MKLNKKALGVELPSKCQHQTYYSPDPASIGNSVCFNPFPFLERIIKLRVFMKVFFTYHPKLAKATGSKRA